MISTRLSLAALLGLLAVPALAQDVQYELVNESGLTLMEFYTSVAGEGAFGDDLLGANVIAAGESGVVPIAEGAAACDRDLRFVFEDGSEAVKAANVCDTASYTVTAE